MKKVAVIQARMGSSRLPGKVLADVEGQPMLARMLQRVERCRNIDEIWIATSTLSIDNPIEELCGTVGMDCLRGSEQNVLQRFCQVAEQSEADLIVRLTGDCPLIDPGLVDQVVDGLMTEPGADYCCNFFPRRRFPRGLDAEVLTRATLERVAAQAQNARDCEHVTLQIYERPRQYRIVGIESEQDLSHLRWTVDTPQDLQLIREIFRHFAARPFSWTDVLAAYRTRPQWLSINHTTQQKVA